MDINETTVPCTKWLAATFQNPQNMFLNVCVFVGGWACFCLAVQSTLLCCLCQKEGEERREREGEKEGEKGKKRGREGEREDCVCALLGGAAKGKGGV